LTASAAGVTTAAARRREQNKAGRHYSGEQRSLEIHRRILVNAPAANNPLKGLSLHRDSHGRTTNIGFEKRPALDY
jgi:hypothetical protein